jgi:uncharacterized membrane protein YbhN (UPF0104 family)
MCFRMAVTPVRPRFNRRYLLSVAILALAIYVLLPQFGDFRSSWHLLSHPVASWTGLAVLLTALTYLSAAATYCLLAFKPLVYKDTVVVELGAMFINRLLPGGIGALGANYAYLRKKAHSQAQAATVVAVNNLLGFIGHNLLIFVTLLVAGSSAVMIEHNGSGFSGNLKYALLAGLVLLATALLIGRRKVLRALNDLRKQFMDYRHRPLRLGLALLSSMSLTLGNILCLYACAMAIGVHLTFAVAAVIFTFGISAGTVTPTPGGLGGFEAGLVAGLTAYHVAGPRALAIALLYRLISYWLALAVGAVALISAQRRQLL